MAAPSFSFTFAPTHSLPLRGSRVREQAQSLLRRDAISRFDRRRSRRDLSPHTNAVNNSNTGPSCGNCDRQKAALVWSKSVLALGSIIHGEVKAAAYPSSIYAAVVDDGLTARGRHGLRR